jgi:predicted dehydrogenase
MNVALPIPFTEHLIMEAVTHALQKNIAVLCEKPLAHTIESGKRLCEIAADARAF